jgi:hypothetical protein
MGFLKGVGFSHPFFHVQCQPSAVIWSRIREPADTTYVVFLLAKGGAATLISPTANTNHS